MPKDKEITPESKIADAMLKVSTTIGRIWQPSGLVDELKDIPGMESLGTELYLHFLGTLPILQKINTELAAKLAEAARLKYNVGAEPIRPVKAKATQ